jgi:glutathione S-transferase
VQTDLALVLLGLVAAFALVTIGLCWVAVRQVDRTRRVVSKLTDRVDDGRPALAQRLADANTQATRMATESARLGERLEHADAAMAATAERLREGRGSVDEAIRERLVPLARWVGRVVAIARLWRMQREMWRG